jgi:hypothetical protein
LKPGIRSPISPDAAACRNILRIKLRAAGIAA